MRILRSDQGIKRSGFHRFLGLWLGFLGLLAQGEALAQRVPRVGYVYPAGGQQGTTFEVMLGGQFLDEAQALHVSGGGVTAVILEHDKPLSAVRAGEVSDKLAELQAALRERTDLAALAPNEKLAALRRLLNEAELTEKDLRLLADYDRKMKDPKRQQNTQIGETVRMRVTLAGDAQPGMRFLRLHTASGLSNPLRFEVGQHPEVREAEPPPDYFNLQGGARGRRAVETYEERVVNPIVRLPATINGRILPGEVDAFGFRARAGEQVVVKVQARELIPYLADAVPGWFQAVATLFDSTGKEVAFADDYGFDPDPVLFFKIPTDGEYRIEVKDSIYRGREDFVYRITLGELPFLTVISPLGGRAGSEVEVSLFGGNLGAVNKLSYQVPEQPGLARVTTQRNDWWSNAVPFHVTPHPEETEREPNNSLGAGGELKLPVIVNGAIDAPGDIDFYRVKGHGGQPMAFEIFARRLNTPVDATLTVYDREGKEIAFNDDFQDPAAGLTTHHADAHVFVKLPPDGECFVRVADAQHQGGPGHLYRLRLAMAEPDFAIRVTPSSLNAVSGGAARLTAHVLRLDGFEGPVTLRLKAGEGATGMTLRNAVIPAEKTELDLTLAVASSVLEEPMAVMIEGVATVEGREVIREAVPAEDMMQAFLYRHLVPVDELLLQVSPAPLKESGQ